MPKSKNKAKAVKKKESGLVGKKIVMKETLGNPKRSFSVGDRVEIGKDISEETGRSWLNSGLAELTADLPGPSEVK